MRLPDELVEFVDGAVAAGTARSRAEVVTRALERERRQIGVLFDRPEPQLSAAIRAAFDLD